MLSRNQLLEAVNALNHAYAGRRVGNVNGYSNQWFIGCSVHLDEPTRKILELHFCQGRNTGRINSNGGYPVELEVGHCESVQDVFKEFELLNHHKRREKEKADAFKARLDRRCPNCVNYIRRITGNCIPSFSCGYKRIRRKKWKAGMSTIPQKGERHGISETRSA